MQQDATVAYTATRQHAQPKLRELLVESCRTRGDDLNVELGERLLGDQRNEGTAIAWRSEWLVLPSPIVPTMVLSEGRVSRGLGALNRLRTFIDRTAR